MIFPGFLLLVWSDLVWSCTQTVSGKDFNFDNLTSCEFYTPQFAYTFSFCAPSLACGGVSNVSFCQRIEGTDTQSRLGTWDATTAWAIGDDVVSIFHNGDVCGDPPVPTTVATHYACEDQLDASITSIIEDPPCQYNVAITVPRRVCPHALTSAPSTSPTTEIPTEAKPTSIPTSTAPTSTKKPTTHVPSRSPTLPSTVVPTTSPSSSVTSSPTGTRNPTSLTLTPTTSAPVTPAPTVPATLNPTTLPVTFTPSSAPSTSTPTTLAPSFAPTTAGPVTLAPTTLMPSTSVPSTAAPTTSTPTTLNPTSSTPTTTLPTISPTRLPSHQPTLNPTSSTPTTTLPTISPTRRPSHQPTLSPTTLVPTPQPTSRPTLQPTLAPTNAPTYSCSPTPGIFYPKRGYWSPNETSPPRKCVAFLACPGSCGESPEYPVQINADGSRVVSQCALREGYMGGLCATCEPSYYRGLDGACQACGTEIEELAHLIGVCAIAGILLVGFVFGVIVAKEGNLHRFGQILQWLQMFVMLGALISARLGMTWLISVFSFLIVMNFGMEIVRPGCKLVGHPSAVDYFWATILFILFAVLLCIFCSLLYGWRLSPQRLTQRGYTRRKAILRRFVYALVMIFCLQYYQLGFRCAGVLNCVSHDALPSVLATDPSVQCYSGDHLPAAIVAWIIVTALVAFPVWGLISLWRIRSRSSEDNPIRLLYLVAGIKKKFAWFQILELFSNMLLISQWVFTRSTALLFLLSFVYFCLLVCFVSAIAPFQKQQDNFVFILNRAIVMSLLLAAAGLSDPYLDFVIDSQPLFWTGTVACALALLVLISSRLVVICGRRNGGDALGLLAAEESGLHALVSHGNVQYLAMDANDDF